MNLRFRPYEGKEPFLFVSYAHADSASVLLCAHRLYTEKLRVWYDEGIPAGEDWPLNIETHLRAAHTVLFFASAASLRSANCHSEIRTAQQLQKNIVCVGSPELLADLRKAEGDLCGLSPERAAQWRASLAEAELLPLTGDMAPEDAVSCHFSAAEHLRGEYTAAKHHRGKRSLGSILLLLGSILVFLLTAGGTAALVTGHLPQIWTPPEDIVETVVVQAPEATPVPTYDPALFAGFITTAVSFPDALQEQAVRLALDMPEGEVYRENLAAVESLTLCGTLVTTPDAITYREGWLVNSVPVPQGEVSDLSLLQRMYALRELTLVYQEVTELQELSLLPVLAKLNVAGNPISDLEGISDFPALTELNLSHTQITDLTPLSALHSLQRVYVSADMLPLTLDADAQYEVVLTR